jgi:hypothetical protein
METKYVTSCNNNPTKNGKNKWDAVFTDGIKASVWDKTAADVLITVAGKNLPVSVEIQENGAYKNVKAAVLNIPAGQPPAAPPQPVVGNMGVTAPISPPAPPIPRVDNKDRSVCLSYAKDYMINTVDKQGPNAKNVLTTLRIADIFLSWVNTGEIDIKLIESLLGQIPQG